MTAQAMSWVVLLTLTPTLELRASIPYAILVEDWLLGFRFRSDLSVVSGLPPGGCAGHPAGRLRKRVLPLHVQSAGPPLRLG